MADDSPSFQRRQALRQADAGNSIRVLDSYPLMKYFDISQRLLDAFQKAVDGRRLDEAYVYGLRFAAFGVESLPKHKDWRKTTYTKQKRRNAKQVEKVISMMEIIKQRMDAEELVLQEQRRVQEEIRQEEEMARQKQRELEQERARQEQQRKEQELKATEEELSKRIEQSALAKLLAMQSTLSASKVVETSASTTPHSKKEEAPKESRKDSSKEKRPSTDVESSTSKTALEEKKTDHPATHVVATPSKHPVEITSETTHAPSKSPKPLPRKMTPRTSKEQQTIDLLQSTIRAQEKRLIEIESIQIPAMVRLAKECLQQNEGNREAALKFVAKKRSLERQMDVIKAAIFNMETQMFMIENAMEDRQVQKALEDASQAMKGLQQSVGDSEGTVMDLTNLSASLPSSSALLGEQDDDDELLEELEAWLTPGQKKTLQHDDDDVSILSMPNVPTSLNAANSLAADSSKAESSTLDKLLKAVLG